MRCPIHAHHRRNQDRVPVVVGEQTAVSPYLARRGDRSSRRNRRGHVRQRHQWLCGDKDLQSRRRRFPGLQNSPAVTNIDKFLEGEKRKDLTMEDYEAVLEACKHCEWVGAALRNESGHVKYGEQSITDTTVRGMTPSMVADSGYRPDCRPHDQRYRHEEQLRPWSSIGPDVVDTLMPGSDPINKEMRVDGWVYRVIGVGKKKGQDARPEPGQLRPNADHHVSKTERSHESIRISGKAVGRRRRIRRGDGRDARRFCVPAASPSRRRR